MRSARLLVVDDDPTIRKIVADRMRKHGHTVETAVDGADALSKAEAFEPDLVLVDMKMPKVDGFGVLQGLRKQSAPPQVVMLTAHGSIELAVKALQSGAADFIPKPFDAAHLDHVVARVLEAVGLRDRVQRLETELSGRHTLVEGGSASMKKVLELAERAASTDSTVLLLGESGTGKEVLARHIHQKSGRSDGPFVAVNCATLSGELLESELFGHEKGAFTGAHKARPGKIELAEGGTLFLDELGELSSGVQAKLLRVLQERHYERVGGTQQLDADVRLVAATNRDLRQAMEDGSFREDLYYRLNVVPLKIPPLRDRKDDLDVLLEHALRRCSGEIGRSGLTLSDEARDVLHRYDWPGNVRELNNVVERAVVLAPTTTIGVDDLPEEVLGATAPEGPLSTRAGAGQAVAPEDDELLPYRDAVVEAKRSIILEALRRTGGHQTRAAKLLDVTQPYLARLIKNLRVPKP